MNAMKIFLLHLSGILTSLLLFANVLKAQDPNIFWIHEDFSSFEIAADYFEFDTTYQLTPNNIALTTYFANIEAAEGDCNNEGVHLRIRGLQDNGYVYFTVPDADKVTIDLKGKSTSEDRIILIYRNDELIETISGLDRNNCVTFTEEVFSESPVTYKITAGDEASTKPVVITSMTVTKYGTTSIRKENPMKKGTMIYPNPTSDYLYIDCKAIDQCSSVELFNIAGQKLLTQKTGSVIDPIDMSNLPTGIYLLQLRGDSGIATYKVIKN